MAFIKNMLNKLISSTFYLSVFKNITKKSFELIHNFRRLGISQHLHAKLGIRSVNGYVDGGKAHLNDAPELLVTYVGQGHVVSHQKGEPGIVVFKINRFPHPARILVDKAKDAFVGASSLFIHQKGFKFQTDIVVAFLFQKNVEFLAVTQNRQSNAGFRDESDL